jgi:hypothetical protein
LGVWLDVNDEKCNDRPLGIPVLCRIPLDPRVGAAMDAGKPWVAAVPGTAAAAAIASGAAGIEAWKIVVSSG